MKKMFVIMMCAAALCVAAGDAVTVRGEISNTALKMRDSAKDTPLVISLNSAEDAPLVISPNPAEDSSDYMPDMENPFIDCATLEEAGGIAGFSMNAPKKISGYGKRSISAVKDNMIRIIYGNDENGLYIFKMAGEDSDYNKDTEQGIIKVKGRAVILRGKKGKVNTALWEDGDYSYSIYAQSDISRKKMKKIVKNVINADASSKKTNEQVQIPNPIIDYSTMEEAAGVAGFSLNAPEAFAEYKREVISVISNEIIQVIYQNGEDSVCVRKAAGDGDISGDYNRYDENKTVRIEEIQVDMRGMEGKVSTAVWTKEGYAYSVYAQSPVSQETMTDMIRSVMQL